MADECLLAMSNKKQNRYEDDEEEEDIISKAIGEFGRWQLQLTFLLSLFNIPCTWHIFAPTFHGAERETWCARPERFKNIKPEVWFNYTQPESYCSILDTTYFTAENLSSISINTPGVKLLPCTKWEFDGIGQTLISEFDILCERQTLKNLAEMVFLGGVAVGGLVCGILSDKFGRKKTLMISVLLQTIIGIAIAFAPWFEMYVVLRVALGFISVSVVFSGFVLSIELVGGHWRTVAGISYLFPVSLSYMSIAGMAWLLRDWRELQLALSVPGLLFCGLWFILPESPRWLLAMERTNEVMDVLQKAAKTNNIELPPNIDKQLIPVVSNEDAVSVGVMDLFKTQQMRKKTFLLFIIWFSVYLLYYGITLNLGDIGGDLYMDSIISGAVEIPAIAISILILLKGGRRWPLGLTMIISGVACIATLPIYFLQTFNEYQWLITSFLMISKFSISSSNAVMPVFTAELYPTTIRNIGVGASNVSAGVALMLVPYLFMLVSLHKSVPMSILAACGVFGGICVLFLPETGNGPLKDTIKEDVEPINYENHDDGRINKS